ncbi:MAG: SDR family NAD(P)-dependent oxidoreductase [Tannerellaceae bacterium]|nr:SDR family NAD(P)-dependent oxidoreductase [Tannerellaceae bacterium]
MKHILIIGATSGIGRGLAERFVIEGYQVGILGRRKALLEEIASRRPETYSPKAGDITDTAHIVTLLEEWKQEMGTIDLIVISAGTGELNPSLDYALEEPTLQTNVMGFTCVADWSFRLFEEQQYGHLVVISSLAGLRGEGMAPAYNATKAFQINYAEGLRKKAFRSGLPIRITDIRPGFVDTAMAKGEGLFWVASPEKAVHQIYEAIRKQKPVAYITRRWSFAAFLLKRLPGFLYNRI